MFLSFKRFTLYAYIYTSALSISSSETSSFSQVFYIYVAISSFSNILKSEVKNMVYHKFKALFKR